jgi:hypothetical protein
VRNRSSVVVAVMAPIFLEAVRMSCKKEASCRIDGSGLSEDLRTDPRFPTALRHQIDLAPHLTTPPWDSPIRSCSGRRRSSVATAVAMENRLEA